MAASVRIEDEAFVDPRIELLGSLAGYNRFEALGRLAHLWRVCTQRETYVLSEPLIAACLGEKGADAILKADLGVRLTDGTIRIKGTEGRIEWLKIRREAAKAGGEANRRRIIAGGEPKGRQKKPKDSSAKPKSTQKDSQTGAKRQPSDSPPTPTPTPYLPSEELYSQPANAGGGRVKPRNEVFDALAAVTGLDPATAGSTLGDASAILSKAEPPYSPDEVREFGRRFWELCSYAAAKNRTRPTPYEVVKYIGLLRAGPASVAFPPPTIPFTSHKQTAAEVIAAKRAEREAREREQQKPAEGTGT